MRDLEHQGAGRQQQEPQVPGGVPGGGARAERPRRSGPDRRGAGARIDLGEHDQVGEGAVCGVQHDAARQRDQDQREIAGDHPDPGVRPGELIAEDDQRTHHDTDVHDRRNQSSPQLSRRDAGERIGHADRQPGLDRPDHPDVDRRRRERQPLCCTRRVDQQVAGGQQPHRGRWYTDQQDRADHPAPPRRSDPGSRPEDRDSARDRARAEPDPRHQRRQVEAGEVTGTAEVSAVQQRHRQRAAGARREYDDREAQCAAAGAERVEEEGGRGEQRGGHHPGGRIGGEAPGEDRRRGGAADHQRGGDRREGRHDQQQTLDRTGGRPVLDRRLLDRLHDSDRRDSRGPDQPKRPLT